MPLYTYKCQNDECNHSEEKIVKLADRDEDRVCPECSGTSKREAFTAGDKGSNLYFRGNWFATTGRY